MTIRLVLALTLIWVSTSLFAQVNQNDVLMTIAGRKITVGEFMSIYQKNNMKGQAIDQKSLNEYLDLFINFKLKVIEAEDLGLDTVTSFKKELAGYREQLAKPYFVDEQTIDALVQEAYARSQEDVRASHIFIRVPGDIDPADTTALYQKILTIRDRLNNGENFEMLAMELSEDPSARDREANAQHPFIRGNKGDLGYFTVFDMVYPFESAAYKTDKGKVSGIVRTEYGYHLIKVTNKQPAMGKVTVAHLYKTFPKNATAADSAALQQRMDSIYSVLKQDQSKWDTLVKLLSDDKGSAPRGGALPKFGVNRMVPEFIEAIYTIPATGQFSEPILTPYGWHIIKLLERDPQPEFADIQAELKQKVTKDSRSQLGREVILDRIIAEYGMMEYAGAKEDFYSIVTDSIFEGKWNPALAAGLKKPLVKIGDQTISQEEFKAYLAGNQKKGQQQPVRVYVDSSYKDFVNEKLLMMENQNLEAKYPEFKALMNEYRDGILLFDLTDKNVWSKAVKDTLGLKEFYEKNKNSYMWGPRLEATLYTCSQEDAIQRVKNFIETGTSDDDILKEINTGETEVLSIRQGKFSRKENPVIDKIVWQTGLSEVIKTDDGFTLVRVTEVLPAEPKQLNEARGLITADYQNYLEQAWIKSLKEKYPVEVDKKVFAKIK